MTVIMGKPIGERPIPLSDAMEEEIQVTVWAMCSRLTSMSPGTKPR